MSFSINHTIKKVSKLTESICSQTKVKEPFKWSIECKTEADYISLLLYAEDYKVILRDDWTIKGDVLLTIVTKKNNIALIKKEKFRIQGGAKRSKAGIAICTYKRSDILDEVNGLVKDDKLFIEAHIIIKGFEGSIDYPAHSQDLMFPFKEIKNQLFTFSYKFYHMRELLKETGKISSWIYQMGPIAWQLKLNRTSKFVFCLYAKPINDSHSWEIVADVDLNLDQLGTYQKEDVTFGKFEDNHDEFLALHWDEVCIPAFLDENFLFIKVEIRLKSIKGIPLIPNKIFKMPVSVGKKDKTTNKSDGKQSGETLSDIGGWLSCFRTKDAKSVRMASLAHPISSSVASLPSNGTQSLAKSGNGHFLKSNAQHFPDFSEKDIVDETVIKIASEVFVTKTIVGNFGCVAVKRFICTSLESRMNEIESFRKLTPHPNIVQYYGSLYSDEVEDPRYPIGYLMEYIAYGNIHEVIRDQSYYENADGNQWILQVASGLYFLHTNGIIHGDVNCMNMLLDESKKHLKLCDFGLAYTNDHRLSSPNRIISSFYDAPELLDSSEYTTKCDIYSLALSAWEIIHRKTIFDLRSESESEYSTLSELIAKRPQIIAECPIALSNLIQKMWQNDPTKRPEMKLICEQLEIIVNETQG